jgi:carbamoyltransferase
VQTVTREQHAFLYAVLDAVEGRGRLPILANTSMNVAGEPIVDTADEAFAFFEATAVDVLYLGDRRFVRGRVSRAQPYFGLGFADSATPPT